MGWRDLLDDTKVVVLPWVGGKSLHYQGRTWNLSNRPPDHGWAEFELRGQKAHYVQPAEPDARSLNYRLTGYLVGVSSMVWDGISVHTPLGQTSRHIHLCDPLEKFSRIEVGSVSKEGPFIYLNQIFPQMPDSAALRALEDDLDDLKGVQDVTPALDKAYLLEVTYKRETERLRRVAQAKLDLLEQQRLQAEYLHSVRAGRDVSQVGLEEAARAALAISGSTLLSLRTTPEGHVIRFRLNHDKGSYECVCNSHFGVIDSGICLTDTDTGYKWDQMLTLEALPGVILEALEAGVLHVFRRA